jgi:hypothetical protein
MEEAVTALPKNFPIILEKRDVSLSSSPSRININPPLTDDIRDLKI